jgi:NAD/NADP transhydrogenase beta subunit
MTGMPQMVAIFNGVGGGAAAVISLSEYLHDLPSGSRHKRASRSFSHWWWDAFRSPAARWHSQSSRS